MRLARYIGIPWQPKGRTREGCDCWGLVRLIYREEYGIHLPSWAETYEDPLDRAATDRALRGGLPDWRPVGAPRVGDVALLRIGPQLAHVGLYLGARAMLHQWAGRDASTADLSSPSWSRRLVGIYRHREAPC